MDAEQLPAAIELGDDLLWGAHAMAPVIGRNVRQVLHLLKIGKIPARKVGGVWVSRRSALKAHFDLPGAAA
jgi:hypothetical protein